MPAVISSLGPFNFISFSRVESPSSPPSSPTEQVAVIQRAGVDGTAFVLLGKKGQPIQCRSFTAVDTKNDAEALELAYKELIGSGKYTLTWGGDVIASHQYVVLDVQVLRVQKCGASSSGKGATCEAIWTIVPVSSDA